MSPLTLLLVAAGVTAAAGLCEWLRIRRRRRALRALAMSWQMHYTPTDRFHLASRIGGALPTPGAAGIRVVDLIYGRRDDCYRYVFTAEYSVGTISGTERRVTVAGFAEPCELGSASSGPGLVLAPDHTDLFEQYRHLRDFATGGRDRTDSKP
jgi:hypothetical protein